MVAIMAQHWRRRMTPHLSFTADSNTARKSSQRVGRAETIKGSKAILASDRGMVLHGACHHGQSFGNDH
jgi:hypothetical protein